MRVFSGDSVVLHELMAIVVLGRQDLVIEVNDLLHESQQSDEETLTLVFNCLLDRFDQVLSIEMNGFFDFRLLIACADLSQEVTDDDSCLLILTVF